MSPLVKVAKRTFAALEVRNYRLFIGGQLVSITGTWMQTVAQGWLVLQLTNKAFPVGVVTGIQFLPVLLFGAWGGVIADRYDKRKLLIATQVVMGVQALALGTVTLTHVVTLPMVYALVFLFGCATAVDMPTRQAFVTEMVGRDLVPNAVGLNSAVFNAARLVGPAVAGVLIATVGVAPAFLANGVSYLPVIAGLLAMNPQRLARSVPTPRTPGQIRAGLRYVWGDDVLRSTLLLVAVVTTFGYNFQVVLPLLARFTFHRGAEVYGLFTSAMAAGSLIGALAVAARSRPTRRLLLGSTTGFAVLSLVAAAAPTLPLEMAALVALGLMSIAFLSTANSTLQLASSTAMRGRVMALYGLVFLGSTPIGGLLVGWLSGRFGARSGLVLAGLSGLAGLAVTVRRGGAADAWLAGAEEPGPEALEASDPEAWEEPRDPLTSSRAQG